jgi:hypothetical protein
MIEGSEFESRLGQKFPLLHVVQTSYGAHIASYQMGTEGFFPGGEFDHSPPTIAEVKKMWIYILTPPYAFVA